MDTLKSKLFLHILIFFVLAGCSRISDQSTVESKLGGYVVKLLKLHDVDSPDVPTTNLVQLFRFVKHGYPYGIHSEFAEFGRKKGFTNALSEKYIFFWPRFTNAQIEGELTCMSARPFYCDQKSCRIYIARSGSNYFYRIISENKAQAITREMASSVILPPSFSMPEPPPEAQDILHPPLGQRYEKFVWDLSEALGQESSMPVRWLFRILSGLTVLATALWAVLRIVAKAKGR